MEEMLELVSVYMKKKNYENGKRWGGKRHTSSTRL